VTARTVLELGRRWRGLGAAVISDRPREGIQLILEQLDQGRPDSLRVLLSQPGFHRGSYPPIEGMAWTELPLQGDVLRNDWRRWRALETINC